MVEHFKREPPFRAYNRECEKLENYILGAHPRVARELGSVLMGEAASGSWHYRNPDARKALRQWIAQAAIHMRTKQALPAHSSVDHVNSFVRALMHTMPAAVKATLSDEEQSRFRNRVEYRIKNARWRRRRR
jgi:hypothetical protein